MPKVGATMGLCQGGCHIDPTVALDQSWKTCPSVFAEILEVLVKGIFETHH